ncbi:hypothetical protein CJU89_6527 [Yarrowia sp. B02]|nr:hypothetical protein CJU89_6527 [Yarrowia sp. B02]
MKHTDSEGYAFVDGLEEFVVDQAVKDLSLGRFESATAQLLLEMAYKLVHERFPHRTANEWKQIHETAFNNTRHRLFVLKVVYNHFQKRFPGVYVRKETRNTQLHDTILTRVMLMDHGEQAPRILAEKFHHLSEVQWKKKCMEVAGTPVPEALKSVFNEETWEEFYRCVHPRYGYLLDGAGERGNPISLEDDDWGNCDPAIVDQANKIVAGVAGGVIRNYGISEFFLKCLDAAMQAETDFKQREETFAALKKLVKPRDPSNQVATPDISIDLDEVLPLLSSPTLNELSQPSRSTDGPGPRGSPKDLRASSLSSSPCLDILDPQAEASTPVSARQ